MASARCHVFRAKREPRSSLAPPRANSQGRCTLAPNGGVPRAMKGITGVRKNSFRRLHVAAEGEFTLIKFFSSRILPPLPSPPVLSSFKRSGCGIEKAVGSVFVFFPYRRRNFEKVRRFYNVHIHVAIFRLFVISWKIKIIFLRPIVLDRSFMVKLELLDDEASIERIFIYVYIYTFFSSLSRTRYVYIRRISARDNRARVSALRVAKHVAHFSRFDR